MLRVHFLALFLLAPLVGAGEARYLDFHYEPSGAPGELALPAAFRLWLPPGDAPLRGLIVHQHGCGTNASLAGATAADDLHWQALARKWNCGLLAPSYRAPDGLECEAWTFPERGSEAVFLRALTDFARRSGRPEIDDVPWVLWGHSGGVNWVGQMWLRHPDRVAALWLRSGVLRTPADRATLPAIPAAALQVPVMINPSLKERGHERYHQVWTTSFNLITQLRARGAPAGFAPDPVSGHDCGDSRYLAIAFFDACLAARLPLEPGSAALLRPMPTYAAWLAAFHGQAAAPAATFASDPVGASWLPNATIARAWSEYVRTGTTSDNTPPPPPTDVRIDETGRLTWSAEADLESGLAGFVILRDCVEIARLPERVVVKYGRALFQNLSFHDTPERPLLAMEFLEAATRPRAAPPRYAVVSVNAAGLRSPPAAAR